MCHDYTIQDILPAYLDDSLEPASRTRIERHLADCADCREELALLNELACDPVPLHEEAFWAEMPDRVYREVQAVKQNEKKKFDLFDLLGWISLSYRQWAPATAVFLATALWVMVRSAPVEVTLSTKPSAETATVSSEPIDIVPARLRPAYDIATEEIVEGPANLVELSSEEFEAAAQWAQNEFRPIEQSITNDGKEETSRELFEELSGLSTSELDRVYEELKMMEQAEQEKIRKKQKDDKQLG